MMFYLGCFLIDLVYSIQEEPKSEMITKFSLFSGKEERTKAEGGLVVKASYSSERLDRYEAIMTAFAAMVRGEKQNFYTADYELELYKIIFKCYGC